MLAPVQNEVRNILDLSGLWDFQTDPQDVGEQNAWFNGLGNARPIAVPGSWNGQLEELTEYLGRAWYLTSTHIPATWQSQRVFLRVGSANYAAQVWINGTPAAGHEGGYTPFEADVTDLLFWGRKNTIAIRVENLQLPERLPAGPTPAGGLFGGLNASYPATTYDYFPYAGLNRPVLLYSVPPVHIEDLTVVTAIDGRDGLVNLKVTASEGYVGPGKVRLEEGAHELEADLDFHYGAAETNLRVPQARFWSPDDPQLYALTVSLGDGQPADGQPPPDVYRLDIGIRTIEVRGDELLLNGAPLTLTGFGKHEDFPIHGRGLDLPLLIRDFDLLRWVGANAYRTAHYPHAEEELLLADRLGVLVIDEIPITELNFADSAELTTQRLALGEQQLAEMIARDKNHPSVILWCIGNEPMVGNPFGPPGPDHAQGVEAGSRFFGQLNRRSRALDPTRPVILVGIQGGPPEWFNVCDVIGINRYYGWYTHQGQLDLAARVLEDELDALHRSFGKPLLLTEFGADTLPGAHSTPPEMWTEEYQVEFLRRYLDAAAVRPFVAGTLVWVFADFKTGQSTGRAAGLNHKGVFTRDRRPKMAAHFLRSRWTGSSPPDLD